MTSASLHPHYHTNPLSIMSNSTVSKKDSRDSIELEQGVISARDTPVEGNGAADDESNFITGRKLYLINTSLIISLFVVQLDSSIISTSVVDITDNLGGYEKSSWLFTAYLITFCGTYSRRRDGSAPISDLYRTIHDLGKAL